MSYEKQTWQTGDIVTSAKLNHMEDGIESAQFPAVTNSDVGKVLTVEENSVPGAVLVPEETFVFTDGVMAEINMQNKSLFVEGAECLLTVNGTTTTETVQAVSEPVSGLIVDDDEIGITILLEDSTNVAKLYVPNVGTYTVSLYVEGTEYVPSPAEIGLLLLNYTSDNNGYSCDKTPAEILNAVNNKALILACLGGDSAIIKPAVDLLYTGDDVSSINITFISYGFETFGSGTTLQIEGMQFSHVIASGNVTLTAGGSWNIQPANNE